MSNELEESVRILDDSVSTPGKSLFRSSRNTPKLSRQSLLKHDSPTMLSPSNYDLSYITLASHEMKLLMQRGADSLNSTSVDHTKIFNETGIRRTAVESHESMNEICQRLYSAFFEVLQAHNTASQIFDTVADIIQTCSDTLDNLKNKGGKGRIKGLILKQNNWLENERNTWRLVYCLYQDRLSENRIQEIEIYPPHLMTEKQCVQNLYKSDPLTRECQLVIDWLERNAADQNNDVPNSGQFTDRTVGWENTLHQLKESSIMFPSSRPIVTRMDPDAPVRQNKPLHDLDMEDEKRLCKQIFTEIRCGRLNEAQSLCVHCGHSWRAAILEGWRLHHDPNYTSANGNKEPIEANPKRDLWKLCAWTASDDEKQDDYWRASLGVLCGNLKPVLKVCETWEDYLWAYMRVMIDIRVESEIRDNVIRKYVPMPEEYWKNRMSLDDVFNHLPLKESAVIEYIIQRLIIMDCIPELLKAIKVWASENLQNDKTVIGDFVSIRKDVECSQQFLRFIAHLVLVFRQFGVSGSETAGDIVLESYVSQLIALNQSDLVAFYTATLPQDRQIMQYSKFCENILEREDRERALCNAEQVGLDVESITKQIVENIRSNDNNIQPADLVCDVTDNDLIKISALEWVTFYESQRLEAIYQTNSFIRYFLASSKLDAARLAYNKMPVDSVDIILANFKDSPSDEVQNCIKEFLCYKALLDAQEAFNDWFQNFHNAKPNPPAPLSETASFTEKVTHEHRVSQYNAELDRWKLTMGHRTKNVKTRLYNVLTFPNGWLIENGEFDQCRSVQIKDLREMFIPKVFLLLHTVMHEMQEYKECVQLADILVEENRQLYKAYNKQKLSEILSKISESSLALLDQKKDPWGYEAST